MKASVIIPAYNAESSIEACITALHRQTVSRDRYEIIVVDDGSSDKTIDKVKTLGARVLHTHRKGAAAARNEGARNAGFEILLFTDADCEPLDNWIEAMLEPFSDPDIVGVKGVYRTRQTSLTARFVQVEYENKYDRMTRFKTIDFIDTYSAGFRRDVFLDLGGFDESFPGASVEDQEFSFRVQKAGYTMVFNPAAVVFHRHADSWLRYVRKKYKIGYWKVRVLRRYPQKILKDTHTPQLLKAQIPLSFFLPAAGMAVSLLGWFPFLLIGLLFFLCGEKEIWACYRKDGVFLALVSPVFLLSRSWALGLGLLGGWMGI